MPRKLSKAEAHAIQIAEQRQNAFYKKHDAENKKDDTFSEFKHKGDIDFSGMAPGFNVEGLTAEEAALAEQKYREVEGYRENERRKHKQHSSRKSSFNNMDIEDKKLLLMEEKRRILAIDNHLMFIKYTWLNPTDDFAIGFHTRGICQIIDEAITKYRKGESSFYIVMVPFRHGKSEIISRKLPAHYLGLFPDGKVLLAGHTASLTEGFSKDSRNLLLSLQYQKLFPRVRLDPNDQSAGHWKIFARQGECFACGLGGSMAGQGYTLGLLDDYCKNREAAESAGQRETMWNAFTNDFMTRRAPTSITIVLATPWHVDDIIGRIHKKMKEDNTFPRFETIKFPAFDESYPTGTLFPERFNQAWYDEQKATLGQYGTQSLLQLAPIAKGGNILKTDNIKFHNSIEEFPKSIYYRVWDLAHTAKERTKADPDYTSGTLLTYRRVGKLWELWVKDVVRFREDAPERDKRILTVTERDGPYTKIGIENSMDAKDAYMSLRKLLSGRRMVYGARQRGDKVTRIAPVEPIFEAGNVHVLKSFWTEAWLEEVREFPSGAHDDMVDNLSAGFHLFNNQQSVQESGVIGI
jgi:predicted phage terminase large subunit-like protein